MSPLKPMTIVGGGPAGLTLGIALVQRGVPVVLWEAGDYPRPRVCGECLNGRALAVLEPLGLRELLLRAGARPANQLACFAGHGPALVLPLPEPAWCLSREILDAVLAQRFRELGGELRCRQRWRGNALAPGVVLAWGRRLKARVGQWHWWGLKAHARDVPTLADLELHFSNNSYVGICRLADDLVNVCGLFRTRAPETKLASTWPERLRGPSPSPLRQRLGGARFDPRTFCAVAGLNCCQAAAPVGGCRLGDAWAMLPPLTGNGLSVAFESAVLAIEPLLAYSQGGADWSETCALIAQRCEAAFGRRLRWSVRLQRALLSPLSRRACFLVVPRLPRLWKLLWRQTRQPGG